MPGTLFRYYFYEEKMNARSFTSTKSFTIKSWYSELFGFQNFRYMVVNPYKQLHIFIVELADLDWYCLCYPVSFYLLLFATLSFTIQFKNRWKALTDLIENKNIRSLSYFICGKVFFFYFKQILSLWQELLCRK